MSIFSSLRYCIQDDLSNHTNLYLALGLIPLGMFFDLMDGKVARWRGKAGLMGQELDSLADLVRSIQWQQQKLYELTIIDRYHLVYLLPQPPLPLVYARPSTIFSSVSSFSAASPAWRDST
jgi:hypothetical protein